MNQRPGRRLVALVGLFAAVATSSAFAVADGDVPAPPKRDGGGGDWSAAPSPASSPAPDPGPASYPGAPPQVVSMTPPGTGVAPINIIPSVTLGSSIGGRAGGGAGPASPEQGQMDPPLSNNQSPPHKNCESDSTGTSSPVTGNPVILATGEKFVEEPDFASPKLYGLGLSRTYRSATLGGMFGPQWEVYIRLRTTSKERLCEQSGLSGAVHGHIGGHLLP